MGSGMASSLGCLGKFSRAYCASLFVQSRAHRHPPKLVHLPATPFPSQPGLLLPPRRPLRVGSTSVLSDEDGLKVDGSEVVYAPFGEIRAGDLSDLTDFGFTGQQLDRSSGGLMYYGARYYLPSLRRFISADTIVPGASNPQAFNRYSYVGNNPINATDPTGHCGTNMDCWIAKYYEENPVQGPGSGDGSEPKPDPTPQLESEEIQEFIEEIGKLLDDILKTQKEVGDRQIDAIIQDYQQAYSAWNELPNHRTTITSSYYSGDLTDWLVDTLNDNASGPIAAILRENLSGTLDQKAAAYLGWAAMVRAGGPWDFKPDLRDYTGGTDIALGIGGPDSEWYDRDVVANIHYGYVGRSVGFSENTLLFFAGMAQVQDNVVDPLLKGKKANFGAVGSTQDFFDDPADAASIRAGASMWDSWGELDASAGTLTWALHDPSVRDDLNRGVPP